MKILSSIFLPIVIFYSNLKLLECDQFITTYGSVSREIYVKVIIVVDKTMHEFHGKNLNSYLHSMMNQVALVFFDPSVGNSIEIMYEHILNIDEKTGNKLKNENVHEKAYAFYQWQDENLKEYDYDAALFISRNPINDQNNKYSLIYGWAYNTVCGEKRPAALIIDTGFDTHMTVSHEIGHMLGLPHINTPENTNCKLGEKAKKAYLMNPGMGLILHPWSKCSREKLIFEFGREHRKCLFNKPKNYDKISSRKSVLKLKLPGSIYSLKEQCVYNMGNKSSTNCHPPEDECKPFYCLNNNGKCITTGASFADGTNCGDNNWCFRGECMKKFQIKEKIIDGKWGDWSDWSNCSKSCGVGFQFQTRECNIPSDSIGKYCIGIRKRYRKCNVQKCSGIKMDVRQEQCSEFNNKTIILHGEEKVADLPWRATYLSDESSDRNPCSLRCDFHGSKYEHSLKDVVIDGTRCFPMKQNVCIDGKCRTVGCDGKIDSKLEYDSCGVCGGSNLTCERVHEKIVKRKFTSGFNKIVSIPKSATGLKIDKEIYGSVGTNDYYLTFRIANRKKYIFDGNGKFEKNKYYTFRDGDFYYSGEENDEHIEFSSPLSKAIDIGITVNEIFDKNVDGKPKIIFRYDYYKSIV